MFNDLMPEEFKILKEYDVTLKLDNSGTYWLGARSEEAINALKVFIEQVKEKSKNVQP
jgi:hypothetical protein